MQREDVRILLSYVPFKTEEDLGGTQSVMSMVSGGGKEGMYDASKQNFLTRKNDQADIVRFTDHIFSANRTTLSYEDYSQIN